MLIKTTCSLIVSFMLMTCASAENLLRNGNFSDWKDGQRSPAHWWVAEHKDLKEGELTKEVLGRDDGANAVKYTDALQKHSLNQDVKIKGGDIYELSCRVKLQIAPWSFGMALQWRDANGKAVGKFNWTRDSGFDSDFKVMKLSNLEAPADAASARVIIYPYGVNEVGRIINGTILVTDVSLLRKELETTSEPYRALSSIPIYKDLAIKIDGDGNDLAWKQAVSLSDFSMPVSFMAVEEQTKALLMADADYLYIFAKMRSGNPEALKKKEKAERDKLRTDSDTLEIFLKPSPGSRDHYHLLFDASGAILDSRETWLDAPNSRGLMVDYDNDWNPAIEYAVSIVSDGWIVEMKIPFRDLGVKSVVSGMNWIANIARADYRTNTFSSWSLLPQPIFQTSKDWGAWILAEDIPVPREMVIVPGKPVHLDMSISNCGARNIDTEIRIDALENGRIIPLGKDIKRLAAGVQDSGVRIAVNNLADIYWVSVSCAGKLLYRYGLKPLAKFVSISHYDPENVVGNKLYLASRSSNMRSFKPFYINHNFSNDLGKHLTRKVSGADIVVELPPGMEATHLDIIEWNQIRAKATPARQEGKVIRNGIEYTRYVFEPQFLLSSFGDGCMNTAIFFKSDWEKGNSGKAYIYARWPGGTQTLQEYDIEVIDIDRITPFKRMQTRWDYLTEEFCRMWLDDPARELKRLGINTIPVPLYPEKHVYRGTRENRKELYDRFVKELKAESYYLIVQSDTNPDWWVWTQGKEFDPAARFMDIDGKAVKNIYNAITFCPLYRGRFYRSWVDCMKDSTAFKDYGVTWAVMDFEFWSHNALEDGCYCDNCLEQFKTWCKDNGFASVTSSPKDFMKQKGQHPEAVKAWAEFSKWRFGRLFIDVRDELAASMKKRTEWSGPEKRFLVSEWQRPKKHLLGAVDYFDMCVYYAPSLCNDRFTEVLKEFGTEYPSLVAACAPQPIWPQSAKVHPKENLYVIFESVVARSQGFEWWPYWGFDMLNLKVVVDGYRAIVPFEDIFLDGKVTISVPCSGAKASARAITLKGESLLLVRDYNLKNPEKVTVEIPGNANEEVYDTVTGEKLGQVSASARRLELELKPDKKARLLYVGSAGKFHQRKNNK